MPICIIAEFEWTKLSRFNFCRYELCWQFKRKPPYQNKEILLKAWQKTKMTMIK